MASMGNTGAGVHQEPLGLPWLLVQLLVVMRTGSLCLTLFAALQINLRLYSCKASTLPLSYTLFFFFLKQNLASTG